MSEIFYGVATERLQRRLMTDVIGEKIAPAKGKSVPPAKRQGPNFNSDPFGHAQGYPNPDSRPTVRGGTMYEMGPETEGSRQARGARDREHADEIMRNLGLVAELPKGVVRASHQLAVQKFARETENGYKILANLLPAPSWRGPCPD